MKTENTALIVCGGECSSDFIEEFEKADFVIAADSGYENAKTLGIKVDLLLGDFDSIKTPLDKIDIQKIQLPCEKDDTDTLYAVRLAMEKKFGTILLCCATGSRFDHCLANLQVASFLSESGIKCTAYGKGVKYTVLTGNEKAGVCTPKESTAEFPRPKISEGQKAYLSVFAVGSECRGVSIFGAKYCIENAVLSPQFPIGVSNEWKENSVSVSVAQGQLCIMETIEE